MKTTTDLKAGRHGLKLVFGGVVIDIAANLNITVQIGNENINITGQTAIA